LMSTGCKSSHNGFLDVSRSNGGLSISVTFANNRQFKVIFKGANILPTRHHHQKILYQKKTATYKTCSSTHPCQILNIRQPMTIGCKINRLP